MWFTAGLNKRNAIKDETNRLDQIDTRLYVLQMSTKESLFKGPYTSPTSESNVTNDSRIIHLGYNELI